MIGIKKAKYLAALSTTNGLLDPKKMAFIASKLSKRELSIYLTLLRKIRVGEKVMVVTAIDLPRNLAVPFEEIFKGRDVLFLRDEAILAGLTVQFEDFVFDASIKTLLERMKKSHEVN